jgi:predicted porin
MFMLESGMQIASSSPEQATLGGTGAANNAPGPFGNVRQAFLGLGSKYGNLTAGWQYTPEYFQRISNIGGSANTLGVAATSSNGGIAVASRGTIDSMNAFKYESPKLFDTTFTAMVGTVNSTQTAAGYGTSISAAATAQSLNAPAIGGGQNITSSGLGQTLAANWSKGNAQATLSYSKEKLSNTFAYDYIYAGTAVAATTGVISAANTSQQNFMASGSYDFGIVKLMGIAANRRVTANGTGAVTNIDIYNVGAFVPVTAAIKLGANYAYAHQGVSGADTKNQAFQTSVQYSLSKRTTAYVLASRAVSSAITAAAVTTSGVTGANQYALGLAHTF